MRRVVSWRAERWGSFLKGLFSSFFAIFGGFLQLLIIFLVKKR
jgi:hypothetical protein